MRIRLAGRATILGLGVAALFGGCAGDGTSPDPEGRSLGILQLMTGSGAPVPSAGDTPEAAISWDVPPGEGTVFPPEVIESPSEAIAGYSFPVTVFTVGPNGCWSPDGIEVKTGEHVVELIPWDRHSGADACTMIFGYLAHEATLNLSEPGEWTLRVEGRRIRGDGASDGSVRAERKVVVHPPSDVPSPARIQLAPGQEIVVDGVLGLRFVGVEEDSRCPIDAVCVWQGNAAVRIALSRPGIPEVSALLNTSVEPTGAEFGGYRIRLEELSPLPRSTSSIPPASYSATIRIEQATSP